MIKLNNTEWIGNQICNDIPKWDKWDNGKIITIESGTGSGKSYFIKNDLYNYAKSEGGKILLLVHRLNTQAQFKMELKKDGKLDNVDVITYQTIDSLENSTIGFDFGKYKYIVCDEFHYFTSDSNFNGLTDMSLSAVLRQNDKVRIFMSATANSVIKYFKNGGIIHKSYVAELDFSFINSLSFYSDDETEEDIINNIVANNEKAIIFVNRDRRMREIYNMYEDVSLLNCAKGNPHRSKVDVDRVDSMLEKGVFHENLLIATTVMDTGVSIKDEGLTNIICHNIVDPNVLIQVLGRKRQLHVNDKIDVYIRTVTNKELGGHLTAVNREVAKLREYATFGEDFHIKEYGRSKDFGKALYIDIDEDGNVSLDVNEMIVYKLAEDRDVYMDMLESGYNKYIADLLGFNEYIEVEKELESNMLEKYLETMVGKKLYMGDKEREDLISRIDMKVNGRQQRSYVGLNEGLELLGVDYIIIPKRTNKERYWIVDSIDR